MRVECPRCGTRDDAGPQVLTKVDFEWLCRECRRHWRVRTVFFETRSSGWDRRLGKLVKRLRKEQGLTEEQLADLVGVTGAFISHIEAGKREPSASVSRRLLEALGAHEEAEQV